MYNVQEAAAFPAVRQLANPQQPMTIQQAGAGIRAEPVFPSLGSTMGGVTAHSYVVSEGAQGSQGSLAPPLAYISFPHPGAPGSAHALGMQDEIRTIFVTGFPDNVHERELHNLCRFIPGYEASQVAFKAGQQPQVFVLFTTAAHARQAMEALAGLPFDVQAVGGMPNSRTGMDSASTSSTSVSNAAGLARNNNDDRISSSSNVVDGAAAGKSSPNADAAAANAGGLAAAPAGAPAAAGAASNNGAGLASRLTNFVHARQAATGTANVLQPSSSSSLNNAGVVRNVSDMSGLSPPVKYILRCEMAHKNLYVKENDPSVRRPHRQIVLHNSPGAPNSVTGLNNSGAVSHLALAPNNAGGNTMYLHDLPVYAGPASGGPAGVSVHPLAANAVGGVQHAGAVQAGGAPLGGGVPLGTPLGFLPVTNRGDNPPCNTLFIGNLSDQVSEIELLHLLSGQPGYKQMKLVRGPRQVSCFVEFEDTATATAVHNTYQGAVLASSDRGGIRIQYSKNPFGKRYETYGERSSTPGSNMQALRSAVGLQGSGDLQNAVAASQGAWPVVTYHTVQQPLPNQGPTITYY